jgi:hypothetical protein
MNIIEINSDSDKSDTIPDVRNIDFDFDGQGNIPMSTTNASARGRSLGGHFGGGFAGKMASTPGAQSHMTGFTSVDDGMTVDDDMENEFRFDGDSDSDESVASRVTNIKFTSGSMNVAKLDKEVKKEEDREEEVEKVIVVQKGEAVVHIAP